MTALTIKANVRTRYTRGGLDLSGGRVVEIDESDLSEEAIASLEADPRVTVLEAEPAPPAKTKKASGSKGKKVKGPTAKQKKAIAAAKTALDDAEANVTLLTEDAGEASTDEQAAAISSAEAEVETAKFALAAAEKDVPA